MSENPSPQSAPHSRKLRDELESFVAQLVEPSNPDPMAVKQRHADVLKQARELEVFATVARNEWVAAGLSGKDIKLASRDRKSTELVAGQLTLIERPLAKAIATFIERYNKVDLSSLAPLPKGMPPTFSDNTKEHEIKEMEREFLQEIRNIRKGLPDLIAMIERPVSNLGATGHR